MRHFLRSWLLIAALALTGLCVGIGVVATRSREYRASAEILVTPLPSTNTVFFGLGLIQASSTPVRSMETAAEALDGPGLAGASIQPIGGTDVLAVRATAHDPAVAARKATSSAQRALALRWHAISRAIDQRIEQLVARRRASPDADQRRGIANDLVVLETARQARADPTLSLLRAAAPPRSPLGPPDWLVIAQWLLGGTLLGIALVAILRFRTDARGPSPPEAGAASDREPEDQRASGYLALLLAAWLVLLFGASLPVVGSLENAAVVLVPLTWLVLLSSRGAHFRALSGHWRYAFVVVPLLAWLVLSVGWAEDWRLAGSDMKNWLFAVAIFPVVAAGVLTARDLRIVLAAFVVGAALSVAVGAVDDRLVARPPVIDPAAPPPTRFAGAEGDANAFAAALVAAIALAGGLAAATPRRLGRVAFLGAGVVLTVGVLASESRGALVAAAAALLAAAVLFGPRRRHAWLAGLVLLLVVAVALPATRARFGDLGGSGRSDLWRVAWRVTEDHPLVGVGIDQFKAHAQGYVREPGALNSVALIVDQPQSPHSLYLQTLAETGVVGLLLLLVVVAACANAAWRAAARFDALAEPELAVLSRAVLVAIVGMLVASAFLSTGLERRLWVVLALGPAALVLAHRASSAAARPGLRS